MGGLTVAQAVNEELPDLNCHYLFDNKAFPYGNKEEEFLISRVGELLEQAVNKLNVKLIVVACNTVSTIALPHLRAVLKVPIVGVVPAIKPAASLTQKGIIGLLATPGTVHRQYTLDLIEKYAAGVKVLQIGTSRLVEIAENYLITGTLNEKEAALTVAPWASLPAKERPDVVVLGCTHFPLVKEYLAKALPDALLLDSGMAIARRVRSLIEKYDLKDRLCTKNHKPLAFYTGFMTGSEVKVREEAFRHYHFSALQPFLH